MSTIRKQYCNFWFFQLTSDYVKLWVFINLEPLKPITNINIYLQNKQKIESKKRSYFHNFGRMWLVHELIFSFCIPIKYVKAQFNTTILSKVILFTDAGQQTDIFVKTVFPDSTRKKMKCLLLLIAVSCRLVNCDW